VGALEFPLKMCGPRITSKEMRNEDGIHSSKRGESESIMHFGILNYRGESESIMQFGILNYRGESESIIHLVF